MHWGISIFRGTIGRRAVALLASVALLYFAAGGSLVHQHTNGPDAACHLRQLLHMPALAATRVDRASTPRTVTLFSSPPHHGAHTHSISLQPARRVPPSV